MYSFIVLVVVSILSAGVLPGSKETADKLEEDGFPAIGTYLQEGDPLYRYVHRTSTPPYGLRCIYSYTMYKHQIMVEL